MNINMKFNSKYIILFLIIFALLFCVSSVCAQDTNATHNINNLNKDVRPITIFNNENFTNTAEDMGQISLPGDNSTDDGESRNSTDNTLYQHSVDFADEKINIVPLINATLTGNDTNIKNFTYIGFYEGNNFKFIIDHPIRDGNNTYVMLSLTYNFNNITSIDNIISKLETSDYTNSMMLTRTVHVNSMESYEYVCTNPVTNAFNVDMITACFKIFNKKNAETAPLTFKNNFGITCLPDLRKHNITFNYNVLFDNAYTFNSSTLWDLDKLGYDIVHIDGNYSTIYCPNVESKDYGWVNISDNCLCINNITIKGFNNAIINRGICNLKNVNLEENKICYSIKSDCGAAILNTGYCICTNCSFINNQASYGGAVFSQGEINFYNCTFFNNKATHLGNHILNAGKGKASLYNCCQIVYGGDDAKLVTHDTSKSFEISLRKSLIADTIIGFVTQGKVEAPIAGGLVGLIGDTIVSSVLNSNDTNFNIKAYAIELISTSAFAGVASTFKNYDIKKPVIKTYYWENIERAKMCGVKIPIFRSNDYYDYIERGIQLGGSKYYILSEDIPENLRPSINLYMKNNCDLEANVGDLITILSAVKQDDGMYLLKYRVDSPSANDYTWVEHSLSVSLLWV